MARRTALGLLAAATVSLSGCSALGATAPPATQTPMPKEPTTAEVVRQDLIETTKASGQLGYGSSDELLAGGNGTITKLPPTGAVIQEGDPLYWLDTVPVIMMKGKLPIWRDLEPGIGAGKDIRQLEKALTRLGFTDDLDMGVDKQWTWVTTLAVKRWQKANKMEQTGVIKTGQIIFSAGDVRVASRSVDIGAKVQTGTAVLKIGSTTRTVAVSLESDQTFLAPVGGEVILTFADGKTDTGTIASTKAVPAADTESDPTLGVTVKVDGAAVAKQLDNSTVEVDFTHVSAKKALTIPVSALVALADGGYGVQKLTGDKTAYARVTPGVFAGTDVEITDGDLDERDKVVVAP